MPSAKAIFGAAFGRLIFRDATVAGVRDVGEGFRLVDLAGPALRGVTWTPGDKIQVFLAGEGMRTYTPMRWDAASGATSFLLYRHRTGGPGAQWAESVREGDRCQLFGPRRSIAFPDLAGRVVLVGDETSFAVGAACGATCIFEVDDAAAAKAALAAVSLEATLIERRPNDAHVEALVEAVHAASGTSLVATGRAQTIQALRGRGLRPVKTKAYWSVGKAGLD